MHIGIYTILYIYGSTYVIYILYMVKRVIQLDLRASHDLHP